MRSSTMRPMTSLALPAENGMITVIGRAGYSCAPACMTATPAIKPANHAVHFCLITRSLLFCEVSPYAAPNVLPKRCSITFSNGTSADAIAPPARTR